MGLVAGLIHQDSYIQLFKLLLDVRSMTDHSRFNGQWALGGSYKLVIRGIELSGKKNSAVVHGRTGIGDIPAICLGPGKADSIKSAQRIEKAHCRCGCKIDVFHRLIKRNSHLVCPFRKLCSFRHNKEPASVCQGEHLIAPFVIIHRELGGKIQLHAFCDLQPGKWSAFFSRTAA